MKQTQLVLCILKDTNVELLNKLRLEIVVQKGLPEGGEQRPNGLCSLWLAIYSPLQNIASTYSIDIEL